jgi:DNA-binding MarR family transcriptional regulator
MSELQTLRQILLLSNDLSVRLTRAIAAIGCHEICGNSDIGALALLHGCPCRPGAIGAFLGMTTAGTTNLLDRLEARHLVRRNHNAVSDGRGVSVEITPHGQRTIEAIGEAVAREYGNSAPLRAEIHRLISTIVPETLPAAHAETGGPLASLQAFARLGNALIEALTLESDIGDPTPSRTAITLCAAAQPGGTQPRELLRITTLTSGGVTQLLDRLERRGLIQRTAGLPPDKRAVMVRLTDAGQRSLQARLSRFGQQLDRFGWLP